MLLRTFIILLVLLIFGSLMTLIAIFVPILGASLNSLCSSPSLPQTEVPIELYHQPGYTAAEQQSNSQGYAIDSLLLVLEILAYGLKDNRY